MSRADVDAFLAEADDVIADWEGSPDSASWAADGSHERETGGHYYAADDRGMPNTTAQLLDLARTRRRLMRAALMAPELDRDRIAHAAGGMIVAPSAAALTGMLRPGPVTLATDSVADLMSAYEGHGLPRVARNDALEEGRRYWASSDPADLIFSMDSPPLLIAEGDVIAIDHTGGPVEHVTVCRARRSPDGTLHLTIEQTP